MYIQRHPMHHHAIGTYPNCCSVNLNPIKEVKNIPLPNETEKKCKCIEKDKSNKKSSNIHHSSFCGIQDFIKNMDVQKFIGNINIDELILISLICLFFQEGIRDDVLLIVLGYLLIF